MTPPRQDPDRDVAHSPERIANRLHSAAIHLLRRLRTEDDASGLSAPRLSALSVIVFSPRPPTVSELAEAEQVRPPTISRLLKDLEAQRLIERLPDPDDGRVQRVRATDEGRRILREGRARRVAALARDLDRLPPGDLATLEAATDLLERLALPPDHPRRVG